jgi:hypothetical protein
MKNLMVSVTLITVLLGILTGAPLAAEKSLSRDEALAAIKLPFPQTAAAKDYLGLTGQGSFAISQIKTEVVIIEVFNMYCSNCQREAPRVNDLYRLISKDAKLKGRIKMIGIGAGNTPLEVEVFRKNFQVLFPLFPDENYIIHKAFGEVRTPFFSCIKINANGPLKVFYSHKGGFPDAAQFLKQIVTGAGL